MNSLPPARRGVGAGIATTFSWSAQVLSVGIFFSLMIIGLSTQLPATLYHGLIAHDVARSVAARAAHLPPASSLFATFLGYDPVSHLLGATVLRTLPRSQVAILTGHTFFPQLITEPFRSALRAAFTFALVVCLIAAVASLLRGPRQGARASARTSAVSDLQANAIDATPQRNQATVRLVASEAINCAGALLERSAVHPRRQQPRASPELLPARPQRAPHRLLADANNLNRV